MTTPTKKDFFLRSRIGLSGLIIGLAFLLLFIGYLTLKNLPWEKIVQNRVEHFLCQESGPWTRCLIKVAKVSSTALHLESFTLEGPLSLTGKNLFLSYQLSDLLQKKVDKIELSSLDITVPLALIKGEGPPSSSPSPSPSPREKIKKWLSFPRPFQEFSLGRGTLTVPEQGVLAFSGKVTSEGDRLAGDWHLNATSKGGSLQTLLQFDLSPDEGTISFPTFRLILPPLPGTLSLPLQWETISLNSQKDISLVWKEEEIRWRTGPLTLEAKNLEAPLGVRPSLNHPGNQWTTWGAVTPTGIWANLDLTLPRVDIPRVKIPGKNIVLNQVRTALLFHGELRGSPGKWDPRFRLALNSSTLKVTLPTQKGNVRAEKIQWVGNAKQGKGMISGFTVEVRPVDPKALPYTLPLTLGGEAQQNQEHLSWKGRIQDSTKKWHLDLKGRHHLPSGQGEIRADLPPLTFTPGLLWPDQIFPFLRGLLGRTSGQVGAKATVAYPRLKASLDIDLKDFSTVWEDIELTGVNTHLTLADLFPPKTKKAQVVYLKELKTSLPLEKGKLIFEADFSKEIILNELEFFLFGGRLWTDEKAKILLNQKDQQKNFQITLKANRLPVQDLMKMILKEEVTATGALEGQIPLLIQEGRITIDKGYLKNSAPGHIAYRPSTAAHQAGQGNEYMSLLLNYLEDFHYQTLRLDIQGKKEEDLTVQMKLLGHNPKVYQGKPLELNINLGGQLMYLFRGSWQAYQIPEKLKEKILQNAGKKK